MNHIGIKANGMHRKIKITQRGTGKKSVKLTVNRNARIRVKRK